MNEQRNLLLALLLSGLVLLGWTLISDRYFPTANKPSTKVVDGKPVPLPNPQAQPVATGPLASQDRGRALAASPRVRIATPRLAGSINLKGARLDDLVLTTQRETIAKDSPPVRLFSPDGAPEAYFAGFGWTGSGIVLPDPNTVWTATGDMLAPGKPVTLSWNNGRGQAFAIQLAVDDAYLFTIRQTVTNTTRGGAVSVRPFSFVTREGQSKDPSSWANHVGPLGVFDRAADYSLDWKDVDKAGAAGVARSSTGGWLGFGDKYWLTAAIPDPKAKVDAAFRADGGRYQAEFSPAAAIVAPGRQTVATSYLFAGGKDASLLDTYDQRYGFDKLDHAIDWGWFIWFEKPIFYLLDWLFKAVGNFGVAIILLTILVRALMFPIAQRQFRSAAQMRIVQPKMKALQERHKDDKVKLQEEMMKLYREEKINPLAGCLPVFLQIPIFYALYKVLTLTLEMRHQPFALWIKDLSAPDPLTPVNLFGFLPFTPTGFLHLSVLAILLGITMWLQFKLNPAPVSDPTQKQMFALMPWFMMFVMSPFAAGLQIYYIASNSITILQQKWLYSRMPQMKDAR
ncbi:membrane protein insertase YidC [Sphingomonas morindae]|uniref:Membrane protein insertase YidC n=1 Tax=Sphingomonas morindae TaxID=1541170 RepID=A0ABY4XAF1_9SPHN|nr:membrane protein insertase YidC [Sphingomonas morindae]USI73947.1 membrane protein insertase YidC [Sphingomonas morindae]